MENQELNYSTRMRIAKFTSLIIRAKEKEKYQRSVFQQFQDSKVKSCKRIISKAGRIIAVPYRAQNQKQIAEIPQNNAIQNQSFLTENSPQIKTTNQLDYKRKFHLHAGMKQKPLEPYTPNSQRSRIEQNSPIRRGSQAKNVSQIILGINLGNRNNYTSTYKDSMSSRSHLDYTANAGIMSQRFQWIHRTYN